MVDVVQYAEPVTAKGFVVMDTPGYDPVSMTGIVAGGANVLRVHDRPRQRVRLQAGAVDQGGDEHAAVQAHDRRHGHQRRRDPGRRRRSRRSAGEIFEEILAVASGEKTKSEIERRRRGGVRPVGDRADAVSAKRRAGTGLKLRDHMDVPQGEPPITERDDFSDLVESAASSLGFWDNPLDDADWNDPPLRVV